MNARASCIGMACAVLAAGYGCGDKPAAPREPRGAIVIDPAPNGLNAPWELSGQDGFSAAGTGDASFANMPAGEYALLWKPVAGWTNPKPQIKILPADAEVVFKGNYVEDDFVYIPPDTFRMGSPAGEPGRSTDERQHLVTLTRGFCMMKFEVTEALWDAVMGSAEETSRLPKGYVSWDLAVRFCNELSIRRGLEPVYTINGPNGDAAWDRDADGYRLPTEAEWEYACRATTTRAYNNDTHCLCADTEANYDGRNQLPGCPAGAYRGGRSEVGSFPANRWGLYDMHGNLWEWVYDNYLSRYNELPSVDPVHNAGPGADRVIRGGNWYNDARSARSACRFSFYPDYESHGIGLRPVRSVF